MLLTAQLYYHRHRYYHHLHHCFRHVAVITITIIVAVVIVICSKSVGDVVPGAVVYLISDFIMSFTSLHGLGR